MEVHLKEGCTAQTGAILAGKGKKRTLSLLLGRSSLLSPFFIVGGEEGRKTEDNRQWH